VPHFEGSNVLDFSFLRRESVSAFAVMVEVQTTMQIILLRFSLILGRLSPLYLPNSRNSFPLAGRDGG
jgi:hypothetical protein